jgi:hypothetical protein
VAGAGDGEGVAGVCEKRLVTLAETSTRILRVHNRRMGPTLAICGAAHTQNMNALEDKNPTIADAEAAIKVETGGGRIGVGSGSVSPGRSPAPIRMLVTWQASSDAKTLLSQCRGEHRSCQNLMPDAYPDHALAESREKHPALETRMSEARDRDWRAHAKRPELSHPSDYRGSTKIDLSANAWCRRS